MADVWVVPGVTDDWLVLTEDGPGGVGGASLTSPVDSCHPQHQRNA